jgi:hypothetical protein
MKTAYLIFLDGEKHSIWNNQKDFLHQINTLKEKYSSECVSFEELPKVNCTNGTFFN